MRITLNFILFWKIYEYQTSLKNLQVQDISGNILGGIPLMLHRAQVDIFFELQYTLRNDCKGLYGTAAYHLLNENLS